MPDGKEGNIAIKQFHPSPAWYLLELVYLLELHTEARKGSHVKNTGNLANCVPKKPGKLRERLTKAMALELFA